MLELAIGAGGLAVGFLFGAWYGRRQLLDHGLGILTRTDRLLREARLNADITRDVDI